MKSLIKGLLVMTLLVSGVANAAINPGDLKNTKYVGRNSEGPATLVIGSDLSWSFSFVQENQSLTLTGAAVVTTPGFGNQGTLLVFLKKASGDTRENVVFSLGTRATGIEQLNTLEYDDLILQKR